MENIKKLIQGKLLTRNSGTSMIIVDDWDYEVAFVNPYGNTISGTPDKKTEAITSMIKESMNNTYLSGIDPVKIPEVLNTLNNIKESLRIAGNTRSTQEVLSVHLTDIRKEVESLLDSLKITQS